MLIFKVVKNVLIAIPIVSAWALGRNSVYTLWPVRWKYITNKMRPHNWHLQILMIHEIHLLKNKTSLLYSLCQYISGLSSKGKLEGALIIANTHHIFWLIPCSLKQTFSMHTIWELLVAVWHLPFGYKYNICLSGLTIPEPCSQWCPASCQQPVAPTRDPPWMGSRAGL